MFEQNAAARKVNEDRERFMRDRDEAKKRWDVAMLAETAECSGGAGKSASPSVETTAARRSDFEVADLLVRQAKSAARENGKLKRAAEIVSFFGRVEQVTAEKGLALIWPFIPPLVCEVADHRFLASRLCAPGTTARDGKPFWQWKSGKRCRQAFRQGFPGDKTCRQP